MKTSQDWFELYNKHVPIKRLLQDGISFKPVNPSDYISYKEFLKYFTGVSTITKHNLIIGINFTYGWMPRILTFRSDKFDEALVILNNVKNGATPDVNQLRVLKELIDNSLVGTSKLLHFINPELFAIWDSRVYHYLTGLKPHGSRMIDYEAYLAYLKFCKFLVKEPSYDKIHNSVVNKIDYPVSKMRTIELIMYSTGGTKR